MMPRATRARAFSLLLSGLCFCVWSATEVPAQALNAEGFPTYPPGVVPDRIILTWKDDPATSQAVTWRTNASVTRAVAEITIDGNKLRFEARNLTHQLMDGFTLVKRPGAGTAWSKKGRPGPPNAEALILECPSLLVP